MHLYMFQKCFDTLIWREFFQNLLVISENMFITNIIIIIIIIMGE